MSKLDELEAAIKRCDNLDWRIDYDEDAEEWYAWFHPDWEADPRRVVRVVLADNEPSQNEVACMQALQMMLANAAGLVRVARLARSYRITGVITTMRELDAALADLDKP